MITESEIYWITRLDNIRVASGALIAAFSVFIFILAIIKIWSHVDYATEEEIRIKARKSIRPSWVIFILGFILCLFSLLAVPTTKEMCAIKIIPMVANQEDIKEIPSDIAGLAREWIEELKPVKSPEKK